MTSTSTPSSGPHANCAGGRPGEAGVKRAPGATLSGAAGSDTLPRIVVRVVGGVPGEAGGGGPRSRGSTRRSPDGAAGATLPGAAGWDSLPRVVDCVVGGVPGEAGGGAPGAATLSHAVAQQAGDHPNRASAYRK